MAKTSVHIEHCDLVNSESHNRRLRKMDHLREELTHLNESHDYITHSLQMELSNIKREVKQKTGRKLQKNAIPIKEAVVVIREDTSMEDMQKFCEACRQRWGIIPLHIHIHKDEGHWRGDQWIPNLHAHVVWRMYTTEGKNAGLKDGDCAEMQDIAAEILGMERGLKSDKKHLAAIEFKLQQQQKKLEEAKKSIKTLKNEQKKLQEAKDKLEMENKAETALKCEIEALKRLTGPSKPKEPGQRASEEEWQKYYSSLQPASWMPIEASVIAGPSKKTLVAEIAGQRHECNLTYDEQIRLKYLTWNDKPVVTVLQLAVAKFWEQLRAAMVAFRMQWDRQVMQEQQRQGRKL